MRRYLIWGVLAVALALGLVLGAMLTADTSAKADPTPGMYVQLPVLGYVGNTSTGVDWVIEAQNVGETWTKIALLLFGEAQPYCEPQVQAPFKLECTGLLKPGSSWIWTSANLPKAAKSAIAFSYNPTPRYQDVEGQLEMIPNSAKDCYDFAGLITRPWPFSLSDLKLISQNPIPPVGYFPFNWPYLEPWAGEPVAIEVVRKSPAPGNANMVVSSAYSGLSPIMEGRYDPGFGGYGFYAPVVYSGFMGMNSTLYIQNSGDECTSLELWFKAQDDCLRAQVCEVMALAPGYTAQFNAQSCVPPGFVGSVWIRSTQPLGIVVDQLGSATLMSYNGRAASQNYTEEWRSYAGGGSQIAYGPLMYREYNGWDTRVYVQNMSSVYKAKVKVYFVDHSGGIITTLVDWVCPQGEQTFFLPMVNNLPGQYVGAIRVESQNWETPGENLVYAPNIAAVAELVQYSSAARQTPLQAVAYNLIPQEQAYMWQTGCGYGGTRFCIDNHAQSGIGVIAIPSFLQRGNALGIQTELAIQNIVPKPGFTDFAIFVYDQNGLLDFVCEKLNEKQVEYIDLSKWGWINPGFKGSAVISATFWEHDVFTSDLASAPYPVQFDPGPFTGAPPADLGPYTMTTFAAENRPQFTNVTTVASPLGGDVTFSTPLSVRSIGDGWTTWSHGHTGSVYANTPLSTPVTVTLPPNTGAFYFYAEPNNFGQFSVTATVTDSQGHTRSISPQVVGNAGARYFGFFAAPGWTLVDITVNAEAAARGFAIGEFGIAARREPQNFVRNVVGLGAIKVERFVPTGNVPMAGDVAAASEGFPIMFAEGHFGSFKPRFDWEGWTPVCPGQPTPPEVCKVNCKR